MSLGLRCGNHLQSFPTSPRTFRQKSVQLRWSYRCATSDWGKGFCSLTNLLTCSMKGNGILFWHLQCKRGQGVIKREERTYDWVLSGEAKRSVCFPPLRHCPQVNSKHRITLNCRLHLIQIDYVLLPRLVLGRVLKNISLVSLILMKNKPFNKNGGKN